MARPETQRFLDPNEGGMEFVFAAQHSAEFPITLHVLTPFDKNREFSYGFTADSFKRFLKAGMRFDEELSRSEQVTREEPTPTFRMTFSVEEANEVVAACRYKREKLRNAQEYLPDEIPDIIRTLDGVILTLEAGVSEVRNGD